MLVPLSALPIAPHGSTPPSSPLLVLLVIRDVTPQTLHKQTFPSTPPLTIRGEMLRDPASASRCASTVSRGSHAMHVTAPSWPESSSLGRTLRIPAAPTAGSGIGLARASARSRLLGSRSGSRSGSGSRSDSRTGSGRGSGSSSGSGSCACSAKGPGQGALHLTRRPAVHALEAAGAAARAPMP